MNNPEINGSILTCGNMIVDLNDREQCDSFNREWVKMSKCNTRKDSKNSFTCFGEKLTFDQRFSLSAMLQSLSVVFKEASQSSFKNTVDETTTPNVEPASEPIKPAVEHPKNTKISDIASIGCDTAIYLKFHDGSKRTISKENAIILCDCIKSPKAKAAIKTVIQQFHNKYDRKPFIPTSSKSYVSDSEFSNPPSSNDFM
jgi:hypothetical protein